MIVKKTIPTFYYRELWGLGSVQENLMIVSEITLNTLRTSMELDFGVTCKERGIACGVWCGYEHENSKYTFQEEDKSPNHLRIWSIKKLGRLSMKVFERHKCLT